MWVDVLQSLLPWLKWLHAKCSNESRPSSAISLQSHFFFSSLAWHLQSIIQFKCASFRSMFQVLFVQLSKSSLLSSSPVVCACLKLHVSLTPLWLLLILSTDLHQTCLPNPQPLGLSPLTPKLNHQQASTLSPNHHPLLHRTGAHALN